MTLCKACQGLPGGPVVKNLPSSVGGGGWQAHAGSLVRELGSHTPQSSWTCALQLEKPTWLSERSPCRSLDPMQSKIKFINKYFLKWKKGSKACQTCCFSFYCKPMITRRSSIQGIFPTQESNPCLQGLLYFRQVLYPLRHLQNNHCSVESEYAMEAPTNGRSEKLAERFIKVIHYSLNYCTWAREKVYQWYTFKQQIIFNALNLWKCILSFEEEISRVHAKFHFIAEMWNKTSVIENYHKNSKEKASTNTC